MFKLSQFEQQLNQYMFFSFVFSIAITILMFWLFYYCIKCGVRDGINEAAPRESRTHWRDAVSKAQRSDGLPDMRAD